MSEICMWNYPRGFHKEKRGNIHIENFPSNFPKVLQGNYMEVITGMISWDSPYISESRLKEQTNFGVGGPSTEKPTLIGLNAVKDNRMHFGFGKK